MAAEQDPSAVSTNETQQQQQQQQRQGQAEEGQHVDAVADVAQAYRELARTILPSSKWRHGKRDGRGFSVARFCTSCKVIRHLHMQNKLSQARKQMRSQGAKPGEQAATTLELNLTNLESKLDAILATLEATGGDTKGVNPPDGTDTPSKDEKP